LIHKYVDIIIKFRIEYTVEYTNTQTSSSTGHALSTNAELENVRERLCFIIIIIIISLLKTRQTHVFT